MPKLYETLSTIIDYLILIYILIGSIIFIFIEPEVFFKSPIAWIVFGSISGYTLLTFKDVIKKDNTIGKKICDKIIKDKNKTVGITEIVLLLIFAKIVELILTAILGK